MNRRCVTLAGLLAAIPSLACAPVPGEGKFVHIATEEAIIIWDEGAKRQHFIRRASFDTDAKDFGFLVPTPGKPELGESDDRAFDHLAEITAPAVEYVDPPSGRQRPLQKAAAAPAAVTVLELARVAGLDAAVLEATDADALHGWLKKHGYPTSPGLKEWYAPYIAANWKITAFKIAAESRKISSAAVRMSFQTERPFFPYREPATHHAPAYEPRLLRVYFIGEGRFAGAVGGKQPWTGQAVWSNQIDKGQLTKLLKVAKLPAQAGGGARWLTEFEDHASPRPGTDEVYFGRAFDEPLARPPRLVYGGGPLPLIATAVIALMMAALGIWAWRRARRKHG